MAASYKVAILTNRPGPHVLPVVGAVVDAIDADLISAGGRFSHDDIVATATTDESGIATFSAISGSTHWFRARVTESYFVEVISPSVIGALDTCWDAIVKSDGTGTDVTLQDAIDRLTGGGTILICGILDEQVDIPGDNNEWDIVGAHSLDSGIRTTAAGGVALTINNDNGVSPTVTLRTLLLDATGSGTTVALRLGTAASPAIGGLNVLDCIIGSAAVTHAIRARDGTALGVGDRFSRCAIQAADDAVVVHAANLTFDNCTIISATGRAYGPATSAAQLNLIISNCTLRGAGDEVLRLRSIIRAVVSGCFIEATNGTAHIIDLWNTQSVRIIGNSIRRTATATTGDGIRCDLIADGLLIANNFFGVGSTHNIAIHLDNAGVTSNGVTIQGNTINDCVSDGIRFDQLTNNLLQRVTIVGNIISGCGGNGITFDQQGSAHNLHEVAIGSNTITDNTGSGIAFLDTNDAYYDRFAISGNVLASNGAWGIAAVADADVRNSTIVGNVIANNTSGTIQNLTDANNGKVIVHNA